MSLYRANEGDMIDAICYAHYGAEDMVERVYDANPNLAILGPILPLGTIIYLPEEPVKDARQPIRLWGGSNAS